MTSLFPRRSSSTIHSRSSPCVSQSLSSPEPKRISLCAHRGHIHGGRGQFRCGPLFSFPSDLMAGCPDSRPSDRRANGGGMGGGTDCCALRDRQRGEEEGGKEERVCWERGRRGHLLAITRPPRPQAASAAAPGGWGNIFPKANAPAGVPPGRSARFRRNGQKMQHTWVGVRTRMGRPPLALPPSSPRPSARQPADWRGRIEGGKRWFSWVLLRSNVRTSVLLFLFLFSRGTHIPPAHLCARCSRLTLKRGCLSPLSPSPPFLPFGRPISAGGKRENALNVGGGEGEGHHRLQLRRHKNGKDRQSGKRETKKERDKSTCALLLFLSVVAVVSHDDAAAAIVQV